LCRREHQRKVRITTWREQNKTVSTATPPISGRGVISGGFFVVNAVSTQRSGRPWTDREGRNYKGWGFRKRRTEVFSGGEGKIKGGHDHEKLPERGGGERGTIGRSVYGEGGTTRQGPYREGGGTGPHERQTHLNKDEVGKRQGG